MTYQYIQLHVHVLYFRGHIHYRQITVYFLDVSTTFPTPTL